VSVRVCVCACAQRETTRKVAGCGREELGLRDWDWDDGLCKETNMENVSELPSAHSTPDAK
jgi:hypothetical protein